MLGAVRTSGGGGSVDLASPGAIGSSTPNTASFTDLANSGKRIATPSATQTLTAASAIAPNAEIVAVTAASAIALTSNPQITAGVNGQKIEIVNVGSTNGITLANGNGLILGQSIPLYPGKIISLRYLTAYSSWVLDSLIPESVALTGAPTVPDLGLNTSSGAIANSRYVNTSNRPLVRATRITTNQSGIANNTFTTLIYNNEILDTSSAYNPATGIFTVPSTLAGSYLISAGVYLDSASQRLEIGVYAGATELKRSPIFLFSSDLMLVNSISSIFSLAANDSVSIKAFQVNTTSTSRSFVADGIFSFLEICRLNG